MRDVTTGIGLDSGRHRAIDWAIVIGSLIYALLAARYSWGGISAYAVALLPCVLAYLVTRTLLASAFMFLLPMYFVIGQWTAGWPHYRPATVLDEVMALRPGWIFVYASLYFCAFLLPLLVVRGRALTRQALKAYLFVMAIAYAGFVMYPTTAPRSENIPIHSFADWVLQVFYDIDQPYGCFPSLHVAYAFVGAFAAWRMDRGVGIAATAWATLIAVSTVYTKQHYLVDAVAGTVMGIAAGAIFLRPRPADAIAGEERLLAPGRALFAVAAYLAAVGALWIAYRMGLGPHRG